MNHTAEKSLGDCPPLQLVYGHTINISILFLFLFWDIVYKDELDEDFQLPTIDLATNPFRINDTLSTKQGEPTLEHPIATAPAPQSSQDDPQVGFRVHKKFGRGKKAKFYRGKVIHGPFLVNNDRKLEEAWKVRYNDGDVEDLPQAELEN